MDTKKYHVTVDQTLTEDFIRSMSSGVAILDTTTMPCSCRNGTYVQIVLKQGLNRQIRRMCEALGYRVRRLKRVRIASNSEIAVGTCNPWTIWRCASCVRSPGAKS